LWNRFEGYEFNVNGRIKNVIWNTSDEVEQISLAVSQPGGTIRIVKKEGNEYFVQDGGPGDLDGRIDGSIGVNVNISPRYFEDMSMPTYTPTPTPIVTPTPTATATLPLTEILYLPVLTKH